MRWPCSVRNGGRILSNKMHQNAKHSDLNWTKLTQNWSTSRVPSFSQLRPRRLKHVAALHLRQIPCCHAVGKPTPSYAKCVQHCAPNSMFTSCLLDHQYPDPQEPHEICHLQETSGFAGGQSSWANPLVLTCFDTFCGRNFDHS